MIKRSIALCMALFLCPAWACAAVTAYDAGALVREQLIPYLESDERAALLFAAELNISNGPPDTRDYGERGMFGKLVSAAYVLDNFCALRARAPLVLDEATRLMLGPWGNGGGTTYSFSQRNNVRILDLETGKWKRIKSARTIRVEHVTEYGNMRRTAHIAYELAGPDEDGAYSLRFYIARK